MRSSKSRSRNKNRNRPQGGGNIVNRVFDSSGPEGKVRGTPAQIIEKYSQLARDAQLSGDRVALENFQQHSEHYTRMLAAAQKEIDARQQNAQQGGHQNGQDDRTPDRRQDRDDRYDARGDQTGRGDATGGRAEQDGGRGDRAAQRSDNGPRNDQDAGHNDAPSRGEQSGGRSEQGGEAIPRRGRPRRDRSDERQAERSHPEAATGDVIEAPAGGSDPVPTPESGADAPKPRRTRTRKRAPAAAASDVSSDQDDSAA